MCIYYFYYLMFKDPFMRRISLLYVAGIVLIGSLAGTSCKKPVHSNNPQPNNSRLLSYNKITVTVPSSNAATKTVTESYSFFYNDKNRVSRIIYTGNDVQRKHESIVFTYIGDTVLKETTNVLTNTLMERDTMVYNSAGQLTTVFTPGFTTTFQYYGKLLAITTLTARGSSGVTVSMNTSYTSVDGDLLAHAFDGRLTATMPSNRKPPFQTVWIPYVLGSAPASHSAAGNTDVYTDYKEDPILFTSKDYNDITDTAFFPGSLWRKESYHFYTEMADRTGDYLQIQSFTNYGYNVYQNKHLVESISSLNRHANITYDIDAFSLIKQASIVTLDSVLNKYTTTYDYQYEVY